MSDINERISVEIVADTSQATNEVDKLANLTSSLPENMVDAKQNIASVVDGMKTVLGYVNGGVFGQFPAQFRHSMEQMVGIANNCVKNINASLNSINLQNGIIDDQFTKKLNQRLGLLDAHSKTIISATQSMEQLTANMTSSALTKFNHTISDMQRQLLETAASVSAKGQLGSASDNVIMQSFLRRKANKEGMAAVGRQFGFNEQQQKTLIDALIKAQIPSYQRSDFYANAIKASNNALKRQSAIDKHSSYKDRLPDVFKNYFDPQTNQAIVSAEKYAERLSKEEYRIVQQLAAKNHTFRESLIAAGLGGYDVKGKRAGTFMLPNTLNRRELALAEGFLMRDKFRPAMEGTPLYFASLSDQSKGSQQRLTTRQSRAVLESLNALHQLKEVNLGVPALPPSMLEAGRNSIENKFGRRAVGNIGTIRPDQYVIMSLTPSDFKKGIIPNKNSYSTEIFDLDKLDGKSGFKTITRSNYTDLAGMFGHNTAGNGVRGSIDSIQDMFDNAKMLIVDYKDKLFKKDKAGDLIWRKDNSKLPEMDEDTVKELEQLFTHNATLTYGNGKKYSYHVETRNVNGKEMRYVPTNTKGGGVVFVNEEAYIKGAKKSLNEFGVNVFDNMVNPNQIYEWQNNANKDFEARNRLLTPSVPFSEIGGRMPLSNRIAFVDMSKLNKNNANEFGHDGSMFFMPGYIPGGAGTMRVGSVIKGVGQSVDYKKMIRDTYGLQLGDPFYLPGLNITDELKKQFNEGGLDAIKASMSSSEYEKVLEEYFVDVMKHDAIIPDSVIKSPLLRYQGTDTNAKLNNKQAQDVFWRYMNLIGGPRMVQTAEGFKTNGKMFLSSQVAQSLDLTDEQIKQASDAAERYINNLQHDVDSQIKYVFTDKDNLLDKQIRENPALIKDSAEAQNRINEAIKSAQQSLLRGELFAPGLNFMELALANPGEWILNYGSHNNLNPYGEKGRTLASVLGLRGSIAGASILNSDLVGALRYPNNKSEEFSFSTSKDYTRMLRRYGMLNPGIYMNSADIAKMGGGDFDGDTIQLAFGWLQEAFAKSNESSNKQLAPYVNRFKDDEEKLPMAGDKMLKARQIADAVYRQGAAAIAMGSVSKAMDALSQGNWDDELWVKTVGAGALDLKKIYDVDSVFAKTGVLRGWSPEAEAARRMGTPFSHLVKDMESALETGDFSKLGKMSKVNFPSIYNYGVFAALTGLQNAPMSNDSLNKLIEAQMMLEGASISDALGDIETPEQHRAKYLYDNIRIMSQILTGRASGGMSKADRDLLRVDLDAWQTSLGNDMTWLPHEREKYAPMDREIKDQINRLAHFDVFGVGEQSIADNLGYARLYSNARYTGQQSNFQLKVDEANEASALARDLQNMRILGGLMADPNMQKALASAIKPYELAAGKQMADDMTYSVSMIDKFMGLDSNNPDRLGWYNRYINGKTEPDTAHIALGKAFHSVVEEWANARIANQKDLNVPVKTADELVNFFNQQLGLESNSNFFELIGDKYTAKDPSIRSRLENTYSSVAKLVNLFEDEDIEAVEARLSNFDSKDPEQASRDFMVNGKRAYIYFGQQAGDDSKELGSLGYADLITRKRKPGERPGEASGERIVTDIKPDLDFEKHKTQVAAYAGAVGADEMRLYSYRTGGTVTQPVLPEIVEAANAALQKGAKEIQLMGQLTGFNFKAMMAIPSYVKMSEMSNDPLADFRAMQNREEERRKELMRPKYKDDDDDRFSKTGDLTEDQVKALKVESVTLDANSGKNIAKEMALQTDVLNYSNELRKLQSDLRSRSTPKNSNEIRNPWDSYEYYLNAGFTNRRDSLKAQGASEFALATLDAERRAAQAQYDSSLRSRAVLDIQDLSSKLHDDFNSADGKTAVSKYSEEFQQLQRDIDAAKMAYVKLKQIVTDAGENASAEDIATINSAEEELEKLKEIEEARKNQIRQKSIEAFNADAIGMAEIAKYGEYSVDSKIDRQVREMRIKRENNILQAKTDFDSKLIDQKEYERRVKEMESIDIDAYEKRLRSESNENFTQKYKSRIDSIERAAAPNTLYSRFNYQSEGFKEKIASIRSELEKDFKLGNINNADYEANINKLNELEEATSTTSLAFQRLGETASRVISQFGRQIFSRAMNEAKQFTMSYDAAMTEIQMVTLKTDEEIGTLGDSLIDKAVELKAPVKDITDAATALYRQGLTDPQVDSRLEDVIKFSKTAKVSATDAIKLATVATSNGQNVTTDRVFDVVSALGDSAATEALQITKGLQKSLSAADEVGVSFEELVAMLTVVTSKTQLSGSVAGTTMRNIMSRMTRFGDRDSRYAPQVQLLKNAGIEIYDNNDMRSVTKILSEIGALWEGFDDKTKQDIAYALGGTEQFSNVMALMQGFSETDETGQNLMQKYLNLADASDGITDEKYIHQIESLDGAMSNLQTTFDRLINSTDIGGGFVSILNFVADGIDGFTSLNEITEGFISTIITLGVVLTSIAGLAKTNPWLLAIMGIAAGAMAIGKIAHDVIENNKPQTIAEQREISYRSYKEAKTNINDASAINEKRLNGEELSDEEYQQLVKTLNELNIGGKISFEELSSSVGHTITSIDQLAQSADDTAKALSAASVVINEEEKRRNENLSFGAANAVDKSHNSFLSDKKSYSMYTLARFDDKYYSYKDLTPMDDVKMQLENATKGKNKGVGMLSVFAQMLGDEGALNYVTLSNGNLFSSLIGEDGKYDIVEVTKAINAEIEAHKKTNKNKPFAENSLLAALSYFSTDDNYYKYVDGYQGFGDYNSENIYQSIIGRDDVATSGLADLLHEILINEVNLGYESVPNFDYSDFLNKNVFSGPNGYRGFIKAKAPERYAELTQSETNNALPEDSPIVVFSKAIASARATQGDAAYKDAWIAAADMMRLTTGISGERFASFAEMITNSETGLKDWDELIRSKGSEELVNAWASIVETDKDGNYKIKDGLTNEEAEAFERLLYGQVDRTKFMSQYRSADMIAASAQNTFNRMIADGIDPYALWQNLYNIDEANALAQNELIQVIGEDLVNKLIGGTATIDDKKYAQNLINAYSASSRVDSGYYQKEIQNIINGLTGSYLNQINQYNKLYEEQTQYERALYSYDMMTMGRATDEDYSLIGSAIGMDSSRVKELSRTKEGREKLDKLLEDRIEVYSDILSEALLAMLPEDAKDLLTSDMDIDGILETFKGKVSDDVYAIIETIFRSLNITYDGEEFDIPVDSNSGSPTPWQSLTDVENKYYADNRDDEMFKALGLSVFQHGNAIPNSDRTLDAKQILENHYKDEDWNSFFTKYPLLAAAFESYVNNEGVVDKKLMSSLIQGERYGGDRTAGHYDFAASVLFGEGYADSNVDWLNVIPKYAEMQNTLFGSSLIDSVESSEEFAAVLELMNTYLKDGSVSLEDLDEALNKYNEAVDRDKISNSLRYNKAQKQTVETFEAIQAGGEDAADAYNNLYKQAQKLANANWALSAYKSGDRSSTVTSTLASQFNIDETDLKKATAEQAAMYYETMGKALEDQSSQLETNLSTNVSNALEGYMAQLPEGTNIDLGQFVIGGNVDVSGLTAAFASSGVIVDSAFAALLSAIASLGATFSVDAEGNGIQVNLDKVSKKSYGGGGGGNKKTASEKLLERIGHGKDLYEHQIKMVQYEQTAYQNADELGNYGKMIEEEIAIEKAYLPVLQSNITAMKNQLASVKVGSDEWYKLRDAILEAEESYKDINNTIKENEKKLEENKQAILALHTDLEDIVVGEIEARIEKDRDMLSGSVSMQDVILNAIKQRYQDEWDLIKKDIDKKKEALQEEKDLIDQRLDARKEAEDEAAKYEELAELKKQLAMISMDSTRTKDAAALRESIAELEKELGWDIAEKEAENEKNAIQDQIDAYDDYITKGDEELETLLEDSNNFSEEVNNVLKLNQTELFDWMKQNVKEYSNSLDDMQKQMIQGWEDTYKQMKGITDTFWDQVNNTLSSKDTFLEYMTQSDEFINASEDERGQLLYQWTDAYDKWIAAQKVDADYSHTDNGLGNTTGSEYTGSSSSSGGSSSSSSTQKKYYVYDAKGNKSGPYSSLSRATTIAGQAADLSGAVAYIKDQNGKIIAKINPPPQRPTTATSGSGTHGAAASNTTMLKYATGGIADYTGLAWLDGTPSNPERVLSPEQTKSFDSLVGIMDNLRSSGVSMETISNMAKWSTQVNVPSIFSHVGSDAYQGNSANIGDIFVNITEAQITDDRDIEELANVVGQKFVKEIGKQGFNLSNYNW